VRVRVVDAMRGVASMVVALFHMGLLDIGWIGVPIFFVISGFVIPLAMYKGGYTLSAWPRYILKRIARIEPPYLVAVLMALVLAWLSSIAPGYRGGGFDVAPMDVILHVGYLVDFFGHRWLNPVFWTLSIEFQYYLFVSLAFFALCSGQLAVRALFMFSCLVIEFLFPEYRPLLFSWMGLFCVGIAAFLFYIKKIGWGEMLLYFAACGITLTVYSPEDARFSGPIIAAVAMAAGLMIVLYRSRVFKPLAFLGSISYSLYLVHVPIGGRVINLGSRFIDSSEVESLLLRAIAMLISLLAAWLFYVAIEKPAVGWASAISYRRGGKRK